nr:LAGLIDADG homing endonuclease [Malassezia sp.]
MDDGSRSGKSIKWATNSFCYEDCIHLTHVLYKLYNIKTSVNSAGKENQYVIYVLKESMPTLRNLVKDYIVSSMLYKIQGLYSIQWIRIMHCINKKIWIIV